MALRRSRITSRRGPAKVFRAPTRRNGAAPPSAGLSLGIGTACSPPAERRGPRSAGPHRSGGVAGSRHVGTVGTPAQRVRPLDADALGLRQRRGGRGALRPVRPGRIPDRLWRSRSSRATFSACRGRFSTRPAQIETPVLTVILEIPEAIALAPPVAGRDRAARAAGGTA